MWTLQYAKRLGANTVGAFSAATLSALGGASLDFWSVDWRSALGVGLGAAVLSLLKGLVAKTTGDPNTPSLRKHP